MIKNSIRKFLRQMGLELRRYRSGQSEDERLMTMLSVHNINLVFDVGANEGQFCQKLRDGGYAGQMVSFEPLEEAYRKLVKNSLEDSLWQIAPRVAIGNYYGEVEINIAGNSQSSSVLEMLDAHSNAAPESRYIGTSKVVLNTLDSLALNYINVESNIFLKIDTQGYEDRVLEGAKETLNKAMGIQLELSLVPLYEGQKLYIEFINHLKMLGFGLWSISPVFMDVNSGRLLQIDATFFRQ